MTPAEDQPRPRRQYGTGSTTQRKDGRWVARLEAGWTPQGTRRRITRIAKTEADAKRILRDLQREAHTNAGNTGTTRVTVKAWADTWLEQHVKRVRPKTYETDAGAVRKWIVPTLGHRRLADLTPGDVRKLHQVITAAGRSSSTARNYHWTLMEMLKAAIVEGHPVPQRVLMLDAPALAVSDRDAIPTEHAKALLQVAMGRPTGEVVRWVAAFLNGMRQGECLGLTWDRVDFTPRDGAEHGLLDVDWQLQTLTYLDRRAKTFRVPDGFEVRHLVGAYHLTRPKTERGKRVIPMMPWLAAALLQWRELAPANPWGLVWTGLDERGSVPKVTPARAVADRQAWAELQKAAGVRHPSGRLYTLHEARHTAATLLLEEGVDPHTVQSIMGHSSITTSRGYQHVSQPLKATALGAVADRLGLAVSPATAPPDPPASPAHQVTAAASSPSA